MSLCDTGAVTARYLIEVADALSVIDIALRTDGQYRARDVAVASLRAHGWECEACAVVVLGDAVVLGFPLAPLRRAVDEHFQTKE